jgi:hypothetical protein
MVKSTCFFKLRYFRLSKYSQLGCAKINFCIDNTIQVFYVLFELGCAAGS